jgi:hypothetical protein
MSTKEKVIKNNQSLVPFFGERMDFIRGLDPLGLQNTSDATFSMLLPGLNNVTGRIRYYSFYCWLLDEYAKRVGSTAPDLQRKFIRTAEYIIALCSQYYENGNGSIPGSNYASVQVQNEKNTVHDLNAGIFKPDGTTANTYWNYSWGAFGQYYIGSIRDIGIIIDRDSNGGVYARTNSIENSFISGQMLAEAFNQNVVLQKELFFECLSKGSATEEELRLLQTTFNLTQVPDKTAEQDLLSKLIIQKDYPLRIEEEPSTLRNKTIYYLLKFIQSAPENFNDREFVYSAYSAKGVSNGLLDVSLMGWYYYQFNEFWHFANTSIFNGTLDFLEDKHGPNWVPVNEFVDNLTDELMQSFAAENLLLNPTDTLKDITNRIAFNEFEYLYRIKDTSKVEKVKDGFQILFSQFRSNLDELLVLKEFGENNELAKEGEGAGYFLIQFKNKLDLPFKTFIRDYIYKNIIYRHQYVAFRKIRGGGLSTQKFIIEDQHIRYLGNFDAGFTGPRVGSLISFLKDLNVISKENKLTDFGLELLTQITPSND